MEDKKEGVCTKCDEVISNPICLNCLKEEINQWLTEKDLLLVPLIQKITHKINKENQPTEMNSVKCVICGDEISVCSVCYLEEINHVIKRCDFKLAGEFNRMFDYNIIHVV